jgi:hypothetical protein
MTSLVAAAAVEHSLLALKADGAYPPESLFDFKTFCELIGFDAVWAFEKKWAK